MNDHLACQQLEGQVCISINTFEIHKNVGLEQIDKTYFAYFCHQKLNSNTLYWNVIFVEWSIEHNQFSNLLEFHAKMQS